MPIVASTDDLVAQAMKAAALLNGREVAVTVKFLADGITAVRAANPRTELRLLQRHLLEQIAYVETLKGEAQRLLKQRRPSIKEDQISAADLKADPALVELLGLRRAIWALRRLGDSIALRLLEHDRFYVHVVGVGPHPGEVITKTGTAAEIARFEAEWDAGREAILHAVTSGLRLGDVSSRGADGWMPIEVKSDPRRRRGGGGQAARLKRAVAFLRSGIDTSTAPPVVRCDFRTPFRHFLPVVADALDEATRRGAASRRLDDFGNVLAIDVRALGALTRDEGGRRIEEAWERVALVPLDPPMTVRAWSGTKQRLSQFGVPYSSYPFAPEICAALAVGYLSLTTVIDVRRIERRLTEAGFETTTILSETTSAWFRIRRGTQWLTVPEEIGERLLYEGMAPSSLEEALEELMSSPPAPGLDHCRIVPLFSGESAVWL
jgi:hypothetical protein